MLNCRLIKIMDKKKILVVEDEKDLLELLVAAFEAKGFEVYSAKDGKEGLRTALKRHPDFILLDILMPKMSGVEVLKNLRKDTWGKSVPVMVLSNIHHSNVSEAMRLGIYDYVLKSDVKLEDVVQQVCRALDDLSGAPSVI